MSDFRAHDFVKCTSKTFSKTWVVIIFYYYDIGLVIIFYYYDIGLGLDFVVKVGVPFCTSFNNIILLIKIIMNLQMMALRYLANS
jgi:hypothetical protein